MLPEMHADNNAAMSAASRLVTECLSDVKLEPIKWLWNNRIQIGKLKLLAGHGDIGKSTILYDVAARISRGATWPNGEGKAPLGTVLILNREDTVSDTIKPRVLAAGGDTSKVRMIKGKKSATGKVDAFSIKDDLDELDALVRELADVQLIEIDPLSSYYGDRVNAWKEAEVRAVLEPLAERVAQWKVAVIGNCHLGKDAKQVNANMRILNSAAIGNLARIIYMVSADEGDKDLRHFGPTKRNIAKPMNALQFHIETAQVSEGGVTVETSRIMWRGESGVDVASLIAAEGEPRKGGRDAHELRRAVEFLEAELAGGERAALEMEDIAKNREMITTGTLRRARSTKRIMPYQKGKAWWWKLPDSVVVAAEARLAA